MDKYEAAEKIGVSVRTIARMVANGEISAVKVRGNRGAETYDFDEDEVERVRELKNRPAHVGAVIKYEPNPLAAVLSDPRFVGLLGTFAEAFNAMGEAARAQKEKPDIAALEKKFFLTIDEASELSGLGKGFLKQAIEDGKLSAIAGAGHRGATVIRRGDLERFADGIGKGRAKR